MQAVEDLLDTSVAAEGYVIPDAAGKRVSLSQIDFDALKAKFAKGRKNIEAEEAEKHAQLETPANGNGKPDAYGLSEKISRHDR